MSTNTGGGSSHLQATFKTLIIYITLSEMESLQIDWDSMEKVEIKNRDSEGAIGEPTHDGV